METHSAGASIVVSLFMLFLGVVVIAGFAFWIWMLIHAIGNKGLGDTEKLIWVLVIIFVSFVGAVIYFFVGRSKAPPRSG